MNQNEDNDDGLSLARAWLNVALFVAAVLFLKWLVYLILV